MEKKSWFPVHMKQSFSAMIDHIHRLLHYIRKRNYKMNGYYERLEDVPEGLQEFTIQTDKLNARYYISMGKQVMQEVTKELCKSIYG